MSDHVAEQTVHAAPAVPPRKGRALTWVFAALVVVLLLLVGAGGTLFYVNMKRTDQRLADQRAQIAALEKKLSDQTGEIGSRDASIRRAEGDLVEAKHRIDASSGCGAAVQATWDHAKTGDIAGATAGIQAMISACGASF